MKFKGMALGVLVMGVSLASASANAGLTCAAYNGKSSLSFHDDSGLKVTVRNEQGAEISFYAQQIANEVSSLYSKEEYLLHTPTRPAVEALLTVVSRTRACGRGSCDLTGPKIINAKLKYHETETKFNCVETNI